MGSFEEFKKTRKQLQECFCSRDPNCIDHQLEVMVSMVGEYRIICEARCLASQVAEGEPEISPLLCNLLDQCFFESFGLALRRQLDPRNDV